MYVCLFKGGRLNALTIPSSVLTAIKTLGIFGQMGWEKRYFFFLQKKWPFDSVGRRRTYVWRTFLKDFSIPGLAKDKMNRPGWKSAVCSCPAAFHIPFFLFFFSLSLFIPTWRIFLWMVAKIFKRCWPTNWATFHLFFPFFFYRRTNNRDPLLSCLFSLWLFPGYFDLHGNFHCWR